MITEKINPITEQHKTFMCCFTFSVVFHCFLNFPPSGPSVEGATEAAPKPGRSRGWGRLQRRLQRSRLLLLICSRLLVLICSRRSPCCSKRTETREKKQQKTTTKQRP